MTSHARIRKVRLLCMELFHERNGRRPLCALGIVISYRQLQRVAS